MAKRKLTPAEETPHAGLMSEGYTVLARRYRPQQFADLVGQEALVRALSNAIQTNRVAHAYLFTGARGVGKTSTARILAKALNCEKGPTATPCDQCENCKRIAVGEDIDVIEIDGASNRNLDDVREIRQNVQFRPSRSRYKIYIIDEVHMLTKEAFNALLKTLEEPPPHVKFFFATTEINKIPVTILSRCQRFDFAGIGTAQIVQRLRDLVAAEGRAADDEALELVARRAAGSMRDGQSLLDQLLAFGGERLTAAQVHQLLGTAREDWVCDLAAALLGRDARRALELLGQALDEGLQPSELIDQVIAYWRDLMVVQAAGADGPALSISSKYRDTLIKQARAQLLDTLLAGLDVLDNTRYRLRESKHGRILLEMAVVRLSRLEQLASLTQVAQWLAQAPSVKSDGAVRPRLVAPPEVEKKKPAEPAVPEPPVARALSEATLPQIWEQAVSSVGPMQAAIWKKAHSQAILGPNSLAIRFANGYNQECEECQKPDRQARLEEAFAHILGRPCQVRVELDTTLTPARSEPTAEASPVRRARRQRDELLELPLLKKAADVLGAKLVRMDDDFGSGGEAGPEKDTPEES
jgi:DNA polymerase-3 subunit gamma/tau